MTEYLYRFCLAQSLFGWIFMPLAWVMGVDWSECDKVGELIGIKTIVNEFVAYAKLAEMKKAGDLSVRFYVIFPVYFEVKEYLSLLV